MKKTAKPLLLMVFTICAIGAWPVQSQAQSIGSWDNLKSLRAGQKLQVIDTAAQKRTMSLISVNVL